MADGPQTLFAHHPRHWRDHRYVYPVISRRSRGLSVGVNLNPDKACNFDCVYCSVDRRVPGDPRPVDLAVLEAELRAMLDAAASGWLWTQAPFDRTPPALRRLNDIALSGDGEPTASPSFAAACALIARLLPADAVAVVITNATLLDRPGVIAGLDALAGRPHEIWGKLDAGTDAWYHRIERTKVPLDRVLANLATCGRTRPLVIQALFLSLDGVEPGAAEYDAWAARLRDLRDQGAHLRRVQVYTTARATAEAACGPLSAERLDAIAARARALGLTTEVFP